MATPTKYDLVFYPTISPSAAKKVNEVGDVITEFRAAFTKYLVAREKCQPDDARDVVFENLAKAKIMILDAKSVVDNAAKAKAEQDLKVSGGIVMNGDLVISVYGTKPEPYSKSVVVRTQFVQTALKLIRKQKNVVANIEPDDEDKIIPRNADRQAAKFNTTTQKNAEDIDVGGIKMGTIVLAAHGGSVNAAGTIMGTSLGNKSPAQIVSLLTDNADEKKRLHPKFKGTIILSGCFTAAGTGAVPPGYNYSVFAEEVKKLLDAKGYQNFLVKGMAGPSETTKKGDKLVIPAKEAADYEKSASKVAKTQAAAKVAMDELKAAMIREAQIDGMLKQVETMVKQLVSSGQSLSDEMKAAIEMQYKRLGAELDSVRDDKFKAFNAADELTTKLVKQREKRDARLKVLAPLFSADGVLTYGTRRL